MPFCVPLRGGQQGVEKTNVAAGTFAFISRYARNDRPHVTVLIIHGASRGSRPTIDILSSHGHYLAPYIFFHTLSSDARDFQHGRVPVKLMLFL